MKIFAAGLGWRATPHPTSPTMPANTDALHFATLAGRRRVHGIAWPSFAQRMSIPARRRAAARRCRSPLAGLAWARVCADAAEEVALKKKKKKKKKKRGGGGGGGGGGRSPRCDHRTTDASGAKRPPQREVAQKNCFGLRGEGAPEKKKKKKRGGGGGEKATGGLRRTSSVVWKAMPWVARKSFERHLLQGASGKPVNQSSRNSFFRTIW